MKARELIYLLGFRPAAQRYGCRIVTFDLPKEGQVQYAQWLHPGETLKVVRQEAVDELRTFIAPGDMAVDIGAHTGDSTIPIALAAGATGVVLALEPNPFVYPVLQRNAELNAGKTNIVPLKFAATPAAGEYEFEYSDRGFCNGGLHAGISRWRHGHAFKLTVRGENLQDYLDEHFPNRRLRYIKVDAEGYDDEILRSLGRPLSAQKPFIRAEVYKLIGQPRRQRLLDFLAHQGYDVFQVESEANYRGVPITSQNVMAWRHYDVFCVPRQP